MTEPRRTADPPLQPTHDDESLAEVWGDTVDLGDLAKAIAIGAVVSLAAYLIAGRVFPAFVAAPDVARSYAMLVGLIGCVAGGAICARIFRPKRIVTEQAAVTLAPAGDDSDLEGSWSAEAEATLPASVLAEMRELGLARGVRPDAV